MRSVAPIQSVGRHSDPTRHGSATDAGRIAQELFNRLTPVSVCAEELRGLDLAPQMRELVEIIAHATARTVRTARSMARLGGIRLVSRTPCSPNDMVLAMEREFGPLFRAMGIALTIEPDRDSWPAMLDVVQFRDGLAHVMDVAADACSLARREAKPAVTVRVQRDGDAQTIVVGSNGDPVPEAAAREAFASRPAAEPPGGGTALALFLGRVAIGASGGELRLNAAAGRVEFEILLNPRTGQLQQGTGLVGRPEFRVILGSGLVDRSAPRSPSVNAAGPGVLDLAA